MPAIRTVTLADYPYFAAKLAARLQQLKDQALKRAAPDPALDNASSHDTKDDAFAGGQLELSQAQGLHDAIEIADIKFSQERMAEHRYGRCVDCGTDLEWHGLDAYPTARRCLPCQARCEQRPAP